MFFDCSLLFCAKCDSPLCELRDLYFISFVHANTATPPAFAGLVRAGITAYERPR